MSRLSVRWPNTFIIYVLFTIQHPNYLHFQPVDRDARRQSTFFDKAPTATCFQHSIDGVGQHNNAISSWIFLNEACIYVFRSWHPKVKIMQNTVPTQPLCVLAVQFRLFFFFLCLFRFPLVFFFSINFWVCACVQLLALNVNGKHFCCRKWSYFAFAAPIFEQKNSV